MSSVPRKKPYSPFALLFFCLVLVPVSSAFSQINLLDEKNLEATMRNPWTPDRSVFLGDWLLLGAIPISGMDELDKDFLAENGGEASQRPVDGQEAIVLGNTMTWKHVTSKSSIDLQQMYQGGRSENAAAYAYTAITRTEAGKVTFSLGSDDGVKVWVNGKVVHRVLRLRALNFDEDRFEVFLNAGLNDILLKIQQGSGGWGFAVRFMENANQFNLITGNIEFSITDINLSANTLAVVSQSNFDQSILKQPVEMVVTGAGGVLVGKKKFFCAERVVLPFQQWPDGVYEFRFTYTNIQRERAYKYLTWYKGDILAAARILVNSAPPQDVRTPEGSIHRMLADMVLDRMGKNLETPDSGKFYALHPPLLEYAELKAKKQIRPNGFIRLAYIDDIDNTPQFCRCYLPLNYNPSKKYPMIVYLHGYENSSRYIDLWNASKRHENVSDKYDVIFIEPHGRWNTSYLGIGDRDVLKCIEMAHQRFNVDEERTYLIGSSMGGFGTWNVATRHPELFAGIAPIFGGGDYHVLISNEALAKMSAWDKYQSDKSSSTAQLESLLNMPIIVSHGDQDQSVNVNLSRYLVRMLQRWNYNVRYIEVPEKGHSDLGLWDDIVSWLLQYKRNAFPRQVRVRSADVRTASAYWVNAARRKNPEEFMCVDAETLDGNIIRVDSKNVSELSLAPGSTLVDYSKPIRVFWNGHEQVFHVSPNQKIVLTDSSVYSLSPVRKTVQTSGPISDFQNTPFLVVTGTVSKDPSVNEILRKKTELIVNNWKGYQRCEPRVKNDIDVTEAERNMYSLLLLGGPEENAVSKAVIGKIPIQIQSGQIVLDGKTIRAENALLASLYQSPFHPARYVFLIAGTSKAGLTLFDPSQKELMQYDYTITDGKIPNYSAGAIDNKIYVACGFYDENWKRSDTLLHTGDEKLRAACAYVTVNDDLSTNIISVSKPTESLLQAYCGKYQIFGGPLLKIFLADGVLKAAQGPNDQFTAILHATSDNEFYVQEVNVFLYFVKDKTGTGYTMNGRQNGQEFSSKKLQ